MPTIPVVDVWRRLGAEYLGSLLLCAIVVGSGISAQTLSPGALGLELLENALATGLGLYVLILTLGPLSGAHFNPLVSCMDAAFGGIPWSRACCYVVAQVMGCASGAMLANVMFSKAAISLSSDHRASFAHDISEVVATTGLLLVIFSLAKTGRSSLAPAAVGTYIASAYFFTSSTSFANPAIVLGRMLTATFAGIAPSSAPSFIGAEVLGGCVAYALIRMLLPGMTKEQASHVNDPYAEGIHG
jgi:glycerol uptake facilitator-like aquaporin